MQTLEDMTCFCRIYCVNYNIDHDITLDGATSYWSYQLSIQPSAEGQMDLLRKMFRGEDYLADETKGEFLVRYPVYTNEKILRLDEVFARFETYGAELANATFQVQVLIAPKDDEYLEAFSRAQKWEWLISAECITELFLSGSFTPHGPVFHQVFHSCHQAEMNRTLTDDIPHLLNTWNMMLHGMMTASESKMGLRDYLDCDLMAKADHVYNVPFENVGEMTMVYNMCCSLELNKNYTIKVVKNGLETDINCVALTDIIFAVAISALYNLFGSDIIR